MSLKLASNLDTTPATCIKFYWYFTQIKIGPILVYTRSFKSFELTGANQESSFPTHVTQHLAMRQISSNSDSNVINVIAMLMSLIKYLNIIWGSGSSMKAISVNPRTDKEGGGDGCHPRSKVFSKF